MNASRRPSPNFTRLFPQLSNWRARATERPFHLYSRSFLEAEDARLVDMLCEDAVSGQERIVDLVMTGRAGPGAMAEGGL